MSTRINHAKAAVEMLMDAQKESDLQTIEVICAGAQVHATLALVEHQRIANLIAYLDQAQTLPPGERLSPSEQADMALIAATAREGLGL